MQFAHTMERAASYAVSAFGRMTDHKVPPTPDNYAIWYAYVSDGLPDLRKEIDQLLAEGTPFTPDVCESLFLRHFGSERERLGLDDASRRLESAMDSVAEAVGSVEKGAAAYGRELADFSGRIGDGSGDVAAVLAAMQEKTRQMTAMNAALERQLTESRNEVTELRANLDKVEEEASTDALTGISNRKVFDRILQESAADAQTHTGFLSLLMVDIDFFKKFNDTHGHLLGDQVLKLVAKTLVETVRDDDTAARYGGEEFAVVMPGAPLREALQVAENIRRTVAGKRIVNRRTGQDMGRVTLSIGVAEMSLGEALTGFIQRADEALYAAKRGGRNRVVSQEAADRMVG